MRTIFTALLIFTGILSAKAQSDNSHGFMPIPQSVKLRGGDFIFTSQFNIGINGPVSKKLIAAVNRFYQQMGKRTGLYFRQEYITALDNREDAQLFVRYNKTITTQIGMDESYKLSISPAKIVLAASTDIGALRGLETLYQMVNSFNDRFSCQDAEISDYPRFKWRGMMIDVARHFIPVEVLKRNIEAMAEVKMNVLHLHLSDDEGFRVESKVYPKLQQAGSNGLFYTQQQIKEIVTYAHDRGIIVVPEFDLPGHCTSILAAYPFLASYPAKYKPARRYNLDTVKNFNLMKVMKLISETPTPTIDPTKETTYIFFDHLFKEMGNLFPDAYLHIGADENNGVAWKQNATITAFMKAKGMKSTDDLQAFFVKRMYAIAKKYKKHLIGWEEVFNQSLPADVIVQKWKPLADETLANKIIKHNNQLIISNGYYLDLSMPAYIHYLNDPVPANVNPADADKGILGAEAAIWSELVNAENEEIRVWPRAAVIAERMWSAAAIKDVDDMYRRLWLVDFELNDRGLEEESNYIKIISRWVNGKDITYVKTLADLCTPIKGYRRLMAGMYASVTEHPNLSSPMVNIADMVHCDSEPRLEFRKLVADYLAYDSNYSEQQLKVQLQIWINNHVGFDASSPKSPYVIQLIKLSDRLLAAATIGLEVLNHTGDRDEQLRKLQQMDVPIYEVQLSVLPEIKALVTGKLEEEPAAYPLF